MTSALPVLYERNLRSALPHVTVARRGSFLLCVGRSEAVRARVEDALAERLGPGKVLVRGSLAARRSDLWQVLIDARNASGGKPEDTVLSFRLGGQPAWEQERLFGLNVGRETRAVERLRLLLWVDGFEQFEALRSQAPDLWAVRTDVHFYMSREDFEGPAGGAPREVEGFDEKIRQADEDLQRPGIGVSERFMALTNKADLMREQARYEDALHLLEEAERERVRSEAEGEIFGASAHAVALQMRCGILECLQRFSEMRQLAKAATEEALSDGNTWLGRRASTQLASALRIAEAYGAALAMYGNALRYHAQIIKSGESMVLGAAPTFANRANTWLSIGDIARAEADASEARRELSSCGPEEGNHSFAQAIDENLGASVARLRGRPIEELTHIHKGCAHFIEIQAWDRLDGTLQDVSGAYKRTGLLDDARSIAEQGMGRLNRAGSPLDGAAWHVRIAVIAGDTGDLAEAHRRCELAVEALQARASDAEQAALAAIAEAQIHATDWADALPPEAAAQHREEARRLLEDVLRQPVSIDRHMEAHLALGRLHRACARFDESAAALTTYLSFARADQGPARAARTSIELARTSLARGDATEALLHLSAAAADLAREEPLHRSRFVQKEILVVRHEAHRALDDRTSAHADLVEALTIVRAEGLRLEELDVIQLLAELPPADSVLDHRLASAREAAAIARDVLWPAEEARALATLASLELQSGALEAARASLEEATWLANAVGPASLRDRVRDLSTKLAPQA